MCLCFKPAIEYPNQIRSIDSLLIGKISPYLLKAIYQKSVFENDLSIILESCYKSWNVIRRGVIYTMLPISVKCWALRRRGSSADCGEHSTVAWDGRRGLSRVKLSWDILKKTQDIREQNKQWCGPNSPYKLILKQVELQCKLDDVRPSELWFAMLAARARAGRGVLDVGKWPLSSSRQSQLPVDQITKSILARRIQDWPTTEWTIRTLMRPVLWSRECQGTVQWPGEVSPATLGQGLELRQMVRTPRTRATGAQEATLDPGDILAPATTRAMDLLRDLQVLQEATLATLAPLTPAADLLQVVPHPPWTPCCKTEARGFQAAMREGRLRDQADPLGALVEATLAGDTRLTRTTEDR